MFIYIPLAVTRSILNGFFFENRVLAPFSNFLLKPEVDLNYQKFRFLTAIIPEKMPFEFLKSVYYFSSYEQKAFS